MLFLGLLLGMAVDFRIANILLSAGCLCYLGLAALSGRTAKAFVDCFMFIAAFAVGLVPTLIANWLNAGSPLATTYGGGDTAPPVFEHGAAAVLSERPARMAVIIALIWAGWLAIASRPQGLRAVAILTIANLSINLAFFLSHAISTPYYLMPAAMLSLWSLTFGTLRAAGVGRRPARVEAMMKLVA